MLYEIVLFLKGSKKKKKKNPSSWVQWLTPVILATQEADIRRITV
jgi:hypothetical protein